MNPVAYRVSQLLLVGALTACVAPQPPAPAAPARLRIIATNDFHGALEPRRIGGARRGGAAALAATISRAESECIAPACEWILLDAGDEFQGTLASNLAFGRPISDIFNHVGYAAAALGNHEFDWGQDTLRARMHDERYGVLAANVRYTDGRDVPWIRDDTLILRGAFRIGVIGLLTRSTTTAAKASLIQGLRFDDPAPIVDSIAADLRRRGANTIIVVAHMGGFCDQDGTTNCRGEIFDMVKALKAPIDAVIAGHSHTLINTALNGIPIVQALSSGIAIDVVDLPLDRMRAAARHEARPVYTDSVAPDVVVAQRVAAAEAAVAEKASAVIATSAQELRQSDDSPLGDLVADAMRAAGNANFGVMNRGGIRAPLHAGTIRYRDVFEISPFGNVLYKITAKGADMRHYFEKIVGGRNPNAWVSGVHIVYDSTRSPGSRITSLTLPDGQPFDDAATYSVVINDFMLTGGSGLAFPGQPITSEPVNVTDLDALIAYLESLPQPVSVKPEARIRVQP